MTGHPFGGPALNDYCEMTTLRAIIIVIAAALLSACATTARAQEAASCVSSIRVLFNQYGTTPIATGSTIWFSGVLGATPISAHGCAICIGRLAASYTGRRRHAAI